MAKKKKVPEKPQKQVREYYDYNKCRDYLEAKYGYSERDYAGMSKGKGVNVSVPYLDFWHWVLENQEVHNGCFISFSRGVLEEIEEDWVKEIYTRYLDEFADEKGELEMYVWW